MPSFRRPRQLEVCLRALREQSCPPAELIVVSREDDYATAQTARRFNAIDTRVDRAGQLAAMAAGTRRASADFIGFVDDDVEVPPHWLERCMSHFARPDVGAVSGRDLVVGEPEGKTEPDPGRISAWGKLRGDHHLGIGSARSVEILKAANMVLRREALSLPEHLRGEGAQVHLEVAVCLAAVTAGWTLIFDPEIVVQHRPAPRWDDDQRGSPSRKAVENASYNLVRAICSFRPRLIRRRAVFGLLIGDRAVPGLVRSIVAVLCGDLGTARKLVPSLVGQSCALLDTLREGPLRMTSVADERTR